MTTPEKNLLPAWLYHLVGELIEQEEIHPTLLFKSGAFEGTRKWEWCPAVALKLVPEDVIEAAKKVRREAREAAQTALEAKLNQGIADISTILYSMGLPEPVVHNITTIIKNKKQKNRDK